MTQHVSTLLLRHDEGDIANLLNLGDLVPLFTWAVYASTIRVNLLLIHLLTKAKQTRIQL